MEEARIKKYNKLKAILKDLGKVAVAFSGGVDSSLLLYAAVDALGEKVIAVTAVSDIRHSDEKRRAEEIARKKGVEHIIIESDELDIPEVRSNSKNRCYHCKKNIFSRVRDIAGKKGINNVVEASTCDDMHAYRPGLQAVKELKIKSPLVEAGFVKQDVLAVLRELDEAIFKTPGESCLLTRFPYGEEIDDRKLARVKKAEEVLKAAGFSLVRVRTYKDIARIEVEKEELNRFVEEGRRVEILDKLKALGYKYITVDLEGFRSGSMDL